MNDNDICMTLTTKLAEDLLSLGNTPLPLKVALATALVAGEEGLTEVEWDEGELESMVGTKRDGSEFSAGELSRAVITGIGLGLLAMGSTTKRTQTA